MFWRVVVVVNRCIRCGRDGIAGNNGTERAGHVWLSETEPEPNQTGFVSYFARTPPCRLHLPRVPPPCPPSVPRRRLLRPVVIVFFRLAPSAVPPPQTLPTQISLLPPSARCCSYFLNTDIIIVYLLQHRVLYAFILNFLLHLPPRISCLACNATGRVQRVYTVLISDFILIIIMKNFAILLYRGISYV